MDRKFCLIDSLFLFFFFWGVFYTLKWKSEQLFKTHQKKLFQLGQVEWGSDPCAVGHNTSWKVHQNCLKVSFACYKSCSKPLNSPEGFRGVPGVLNGWRPLSVCCLCLPCLSFVRKISHYRLNLHMKHRLSWPLGSQQNSHISHTVCFSASTIPLQPVSDRPQHYSLIWNFFSSSLFPLSLAQVFSRTASVQLVADLHLLRLLSMGK